MYVLFVFLCCYIYAKVFTIGVTLDLLNKEMFTILLHSSNPCNCIVGLLYKGGERQALVSKTSSVHVHIVYVRGFSVHMLICTDTLNALACRGVLLKSNVPLCNTCRCTEGIV